MTCLSLILKPQSIAQPVFNRLKSLSGTFTPDTMMSPCSALCILFVLASAFPMVVFSATCPLTGLAPQKPAQPLHRCLAASETSCCSVCDDFINPLKILSVKGAQTIGILYPSLGNIPGGGGFSSLTLCSFFVGQDECLNILEALSCEILCNADSERYLSVTNGTASLRVCNAFVNKLYKACGNVTIPIIETPASQLFPTPTDLFSTLLLPIATAATTSISTGNGIIVPDANGTDTCFNGVPDSQIPTTSLCCDALTNTPTQCLVGADPTYAAQINRTISPANCPNIERESPSTASGPLASTPIGSPSLAPTPPSSPSNSLGIPPTTSPSPKPSDASTSSFSILPLLLVISAILFMV